MKKILIYLLVVLSLLLVGCSSKEEAEEEKEVSAEEKLEKQYDVIRSVGKEAIEYSVKSRSDWNDYSGTAHIVAQVPSYTEIFLEAYEKEDMTRALVSAIRRKEYSTVEYSGYAPYTIYDGVETIDTDEAFESFIEQELIKAINAVMEKESQTEVAE